MALKYNKKDYDLYKQSFYKNPQVNPISGRHIDINKGTYSKLVAEFGDPFKVYTFNQFEQLPEELQAEIYSQDKSTLIKSKLVSKSSQKVVKNKLCDFKITNKEFINYVKNFLPETVFAMPYKKVLIDTGSTSKFNVTKFTLKDYPTINKKLSYYFTINTIEIENKLVIFGSRHSAYNFEEDKLVESEYDLITAYLIYNQRKLCQTIPNYAKNQVIKLLTLKQQQIQDKYIDLLGWYFYLRTNLSQFHYELHRNEYYNYVVTVDDKGDITNDTEHLLEQLQYDCQELYNVLLNYLHKL